MVSANYELVIPVRLYVASAPILNLPAAFLYCCPVTVLEWNAGHGCVLPPVTKLESLVFHHSRAPRILSNL
jgi:hypothetical protein